MDRSKLSTAELMAGVGGLILLVGLLFVKWYGVSVDTPFGDFGGVSASAWNGAGFLGVIANLIILAAGIAGVGLAVTKMAAKSVSMPVAASALTAAGGFAAVALIVLRMIFRPGGEGVGLRFGIFLALAGAVIQAIGGWRAMQEEGTSFGEARDQVKEAASSLGDDDSGDSGAAPPPPPPPPTSPPAP